MGHGLWPQIPFLLPQASTIAADQDRVFWGITLVGLLYAVLVTTGVVAFAIRYRRGSRVNRVLPAHEGIALELTWTLIPLVMAMGLFVWATSVYFNMIRPPANAMEVFVVGKQWMWKMQHASTGKWEMNELHLPKGRPVRLTMISEDVIHDFFVPAMRMKQDVIPGTYTQMWFEPTEVGRFHIFCAQYCGTNHSIMGGYVTVMEPQDFERWMSTGNLNNSSSAAGEKLFRNLGCTGCHGPNASVRAPSLNGIYNQPVAIQLPTDASITGTGSPDDGNGNVNRPLSGRTQTIIADYRYLHDSIILPEKEIAAGYKPIMPSYKGRVKEEELLQLIDYIKSLKTSNGTNNGLGDAYDPMGTRGNGNNGNPTGGNGGVNGGGPAVGGGGMGNTGQGTDTGNATGDMANVRDRESTYRSNDGGTDAANTGQGTDTGNATGDMANIRDREAAFKGNPTNNALIDNSAGGMVNERGTRDRLGVYNSDAYADSAARAYSGMPAGMPSSRAPKGQASASKAKGINSRYKNVAGAAAKAQTRSSIRMDGDTGRTMPRTPQQRKQQVQQATQGTTTR